MCRSARRFIPQSIAQSSEIRQIVPRSLYFEISTRTEIGGSTRDRSFQTSLPADAVGHRKPDCDGESHAATPFALQRSCGAG